MSWCTPWPLMAATLYAFKNSRGSENVIWVKSLLSRFVFFMTIIYVLCRCAVCICFFYLILPSHRFLEIQLDLGLKVASQGTKKLTVPTLSQWERTFTFRNLDWHDYVWCPLQSPDPWIFIPKLKVPGSALLALFHISLRCNCPFMNIQYTV